MSPSETRRRLRRFIDERVAASSCAPHRRREIADYYITGQGALPQALQVFLDWVREHASEIDVLVLWGSYLRGDESAHSFTLPHGRHDSLLDGPSDLDGLLVTAKALELPHLAATYVVLDGTLTATARVTLNVFRDVIQLPRSGLHASLLDRPQRHRSCIVRAYGATGLVLKTTAEADAVLRSFDGDADHAEITLQRMEERFAQLRRFTS